MAFARCVLPIKLASKAVTSLLLIVNRNNAAKPIRFLHRVNVKSALIIKYPTQKINIHHAF